MPSWNIHLSIGNTLSSKYKVNKNTFLFASLLPDYKPSFRHEAHFYGDKLYEGFSKAHIIDLDRFLDTYKNDLNNSLVLGYYAHLLADYFYNTKLFKEKIVHDDTGEVIGIKDINNNNQSMICDIKNSKHSDLEYYGATLFRKGLVSLPKLDDDILNSIKLLKSDFINEEDVINKINYLNTDFISEYTKMLNYEYKLYTKEEYDSIYNDCLDFIEKEFDKLNIDKL